MPLTAEEIQKGLEGIRDQTAVAIKSYQEENAKLMLELSKTMEQRVSEFEKKGFVDPDTKEKIEKMWTHMGEIDAKLTAPPGSPEDRRPMGRKSMGQMVTEHPLYLEWAKSGFRSTKGVRLAIDQPFFPMETKLISDTALGSTTTGVLPIERIPGMVGIPRRELRIRDLLPVRPTTAATVDWLKQNVRTNAASPVVEGDAKPESGITYTTASTPVRTVAHFMQVSTQALADAPWIREDIDSELMYGLKLKEETEILSGDGLGVHLNGLITQASAYVGTYDLGADTRLDKLRHAILEARLALYPVTGIVLNPVDVQRIELIKEEAGGANTGRYILGDPRSGAEILTVWGKPVVESDSITAGKFLVGAFQLGAQLFDRMTATIDISFEHGTNFVENEATIRAEERLALAVKRAASFIYGSF